MLFASFLYRGEPKKKIANALDVLQAYRREYGSEKLSEPDFYGIAAMTCGLLGDKIFDFEGLVIESRRLALQYYKDQKNYNVPPPTPLPLLGGRNFIPVIKAVALANDVLDRGELLDAVTKTAIVELAVTSNRKILNFRDLSLFKQKISHTLSEPTSDRGR